MRTLILALVCTWCAVAHAQSTADLVLLNARCWTVSNARPEAEAVACSHGWIVAVGTNAEIRHLVGPDTRVIDCRGRRVLPGFNDAHVHFLSGGEHRAGVQLREADSESDFRDRIARFAQSQPAGHWITGGDWDHERWTPARLPTRQLIDPVTGDHPVFVNRLDGHMGLANSLALKLAGISRTTPDPPGGTIVRDAQGDPTGVLKDAAMYAVERLIPAPGDDDIEQALLVAMRYASAQGVTSIQDMSASAEVLAAYQRLLARGALTVRVYAFQPLVTWKTFADIGIRAGFGNHKLKIGGMKGFADGSLGSTTALFFDPYTDEPGTSGLPSDEMIPENSMLDNILGADKAGLQVGIHAIGDRANHLILGMFDQATRANGPRDRRFRIEHAQHLRPDDVHRFGDLRVIASMQPYHAIDDGRWADRRIGPERSKGAYAFRSLLDAGATLAFGSDWYVAPMEPLKGIYAAVTRATIDGKHSSGWVPEQKITVAEAIRAFTLGSAFAAFDETLKGSLEPGKLADIVVLSDDILSIEPEKIKDVTVVMTILDGQVIFERTP